MAVREGGKWDGLRLQVGRVGWAAVWAGKEKMGREREMFFFFNKSKSSF